MKKLLWGQAFRQTLPVLAGYLVLGMGFGMMMHACGFPWLYSVLMSLLIYAGSMQYAAVGLLTGGASLLTVALTTLAVNARHLFYGISMVEPYKNAGKIKPYLIFALTDETYSLVCQGDKKLGLCFRITLLDHCYWVGGTCLGCLLGNIIPISTKGIDFALTALFLTVFTDQWMHSEDHFPALAGVALSVVCLLLFGSGSFLIPAMLAIGAVLLLRMRKEGKHAR